MLPLVYTPAWLAASAILIVAVIYGSLGTGSSLPSPGEFDKLAHFGAYLFLAVWFTGLVTRAHYWKVVLALVVFRARDGNPPADDAARPLRRPVRHGCERARCRGRLVARPVADRWLGAMDRGMAGTETDPDAARDRLASARGPHAARDPRRIRRAVAPARARQAAAPPARGTQPAFDAALGPAGHRQDDAGAAGGANLRRRIRGACPP